MPTSQHTIATDTIATATMSTEQLQEALNRLRELSLTYQTSSTPLDPLPNNNIKNEILTEDGVPEQKENVIIFNGRYYLKNSKLLIFDEYIKDTNDSRNCIRYWDKFDENLNVINTCVKYTSDRDEIFIQVFDTVTSFYVKHKDIPKDYLEDLQTGAFFHPKLNPKDFCTTKHRKIKGRSVKNITQDNNYEENELLINMGVKSLSYNIFEGKRYKFGIEIESCSGRVPTYLDKELNYLAIRDGSLRHKDDGLEWGIEYVTGVLTGDSGLKQLRKLCNTLNKYCMVDDTCGVHIHISGIENSKENIVFLYKLFLHLEREIQLMLPKSRRNNTYCKNLKKIDINIPEDYFTNSNTRKYTIEDNYLKIFRYVSHTLTTFSKDYNKYTNHPKGSKCGYDHSTARYSWLNLVPFMFNTRGNHSYSLEIRNHSGTTNYKKIRNYLMIFMGILWFVENRKKDIVFNNTMTLVDILNVAYPKRGNKLIDYYFQRVEKFNNEDELINKNNLIEEYDETVEQNKEIKYSEL